MIPKGIVTTAWPRVVAKCAELGVSFDEWQHGIGRVALGKRKDGRYAATVGGVVLSIPRQVGKTFLVGMIVIALCLLFPGLTVLWTAHRTRTATKTFHTLKAMTGRKKVAPHMLAPRSTNGEQEIRFRNGSVIMFGAREQGFGRGFDEVDVEVFDEAQILTEKALEDIVPAANQSRHPSGALLFFMGTPPRPSDPGEEFTNRRTKALSGRADSVVYVEFSADADADPDDRKQWARANPSYPLRTPGESMERMREQLTDADSFRREALGIWDEGGGDPFGSGRWAACGVNPDGSQIVSDLAIALAVSVDRRHMRFAAAGLNADGQVHVEPADNEDAPGSVPYNERWALAEAKRLSDKWGVPVILDGKGPSGKLIPKLEELGVQLVIADSTDVCDAYADLFDRVQVGEVVHLRDPDLNAAVAGAQARDIGDRQAWGRRKSTADITSLEAVTLAAWRVERPTPAEPDPGFAYL